MANPNHVIAKITADMSELKAELQKSNQEFRKFGDKLDKALDKNPFEKIEKAARDFDMGDALQAAESLEQKFQSLAETVDEAANESRKLKEAVKVAFENPKTADEFIAEAKKIKDAYGNLIDEEDIGQAVKRLDTLEAATTKNLQRVAKLAVDAGKDMEDAADDFGELAASFESGNFDAGVLETLRANYGISAKALEGFGAELDSNKKLLAENEDQQRKATQALFRYIDESERFNNIAKRSKDDLSQLRDETDKFKRSVGEQYDELKNLVAGALLPMAKQLNKLPDSVKTAGAALGIVGAGAINLALSMAQTGAIVAALGGRFPIMGKAAVSVAGKVRGLGTALTGLRTAQMGAAAGASAMAGGLAIAALGLVAITKTAYDYAKAIDQAEQAEGKLVGTLSRAIIANKEALTIRKQSVTQIREQAKAIEDYAKRRVFLTKAILEAEDALQTARESGDRDDIVAAQGRLDVFLEYRAEADKAAANDAASEKAAEEATRKRFEKAREAYQQFRKDFDRGQFESKEKALAALESIASGLSGDSLKEAKSEIRKISKDILDEELSNLRERISKEKVTAEQSKTILAGLLTKYRANADQRKKAEKEVGDAVETALKHREAKTRDYLNKELELQRQALEQKRQASEDDGGVTKLEARLAKGEDVVSQLKAELTKRNEILKTYIDEEAALEKIAIKREQSAAIETDPKGASQIRELAAEKERQLDKETAARKATLDRDLEERKIALAAKRTQLLQEQAKKEADLATESGELRRQTFEEERSAQEQRFAERRRLLQEEASLGVSNGQAIKDLAAEELAFREKAAKEALQLTLDEIALRREAADIGATAEQKKLNEQRAQLETQRALREARQETQAIVDQDLEKLKQQTQELIKQRDMLKEQNEERKRGQATLGGVSGIESVNENTGSFGVSTFGGAKTEDGRTVEDLDREISANQVKIKSRKKDRKGSDSEKSGTVWATKGKGTKEATGGEEAGAPTDETRESTSHSDVGAQERGVASGSSEEAISYLSRILDVVMVIAKAAASTGSQGANSSITSREPVKALTTPDRFQAFAQ